MRILGINVTKDTALAALAHGAKIGIAALAAEITAKGGIEPAFFGADGSFQWDDLLTPAAVFLTALWTGARLYITTPKWDGIDRRGE